MNFSIKNINKPRNTGRLIAGEVYEFTYVPSAPSRNNFEHPVTVDPFATPELLQGLRETARTMAPLMKRKNAAMRLKFHRVWKRLAELKGQTEQVKQAKNDLHIRLWEDFAERYPALNKVKVEADSNIEKLRAHLQLRYNAEFAHGSEGEGKILNNLFRSYDLATYQERVPQAEESLVLIAKAIYVGERYDFRTGKRITLWIKVTPTQMERADVDAPTMQAMQTVAV